MKKILIISLILCLFTVSVYAEGVSIWEAYYTDPENEIDYSLKMSSYKKVDFKKMLRSAEDYGETPLQFTGNVWGFVPADDNAIFPIFVGGKKNQILLCFAEDFANWEWDSKQGTVSRLLEDDKVTVYGYVYDVIELDPDEYPYVPLFRVIQLRLYE